MFNHKCTEVSAAVSACRHRRRPPIIIILKFISSGNTSSNSNAITVVSCCSPSGKQKIKQKRAEKISPKPQKKQNGKIKASWIIINHYISWLQNLEELYLVSSSLFVRIDSFFRQATSVSLFLYFSFLSLSLSFYSKRYIDSYIKKTFPPHSRYPRRHVCPCIYLRWSILLDLRIVFAGRRLNRIQPST